MIKNNFKKVAIDHVLVIAAFFLTVFFFGPARILFANLDEFPFSPGTALPLFSAAALAGLALSLLPLWIWPGKWADKLLAPLLAATALLWLQGNILVWDYGLINGSDISWGDKIHLGLIDTPIWILFLLLAVIRSQAMMRISRYLSVSLIGAQVLTLLITVIPHGKIMTVKQFSIDYSQQFSFSNHRNIIVLVLDSFQTDLFQELLNENKDFRSVFSGFTYFRNALSGSPNTKTAIPALLTASTYDNSVPLAKFLKASYTSSSLPLLLRKNGFRCDMYPMANKGVYLDPTLASNLKEQFPIDLQNAAFLMDLSLFRQMPHFLKMVVYNRQSWFFSQKFEKSVQPFSIRRKGKYSKSRKLYDLNFFNAMADQAEVNTEQPVFKFYHLWGLHPPLQMNASFQSQKLPFNRGNYKLQARALMKLVAGFLGRLEQLGISEKSMIFIIGDHGPGNFGLCQINHAALGSHWPMPMSLEDPEMMKILAGALPLVLVKPGENRKDQPLAVSDAPVNLSDIPATVAAAIGSNGQFPGRPFFSIAANEDRQRRYLHYDNTRSNPAGFTSVMSEYWVRGFSWFSQSWRAGTRKFPPGWEKRKNK